MHRHQCLTLAFAAAGLTLLTSSAQAQTTPYSNLSFKGNYVLTETGIAGPGGVISAIGAISADGNGAANGTLHVRLPGQPLFTAKASGQYQINQDGTGSLTLNVPSPAGGEDSQPMTRKYDLVFTRRGLIGAASDQGLFSTVDFEAQPAAPAAGYTLAAIAGNYGYSETGVVNNTTRIAIGDFALSATGAVTGTIEERAAGRGALSLRFTGTYTVSPDGSGTITIQRAEAPTGEDGDTQVIESKFNFVLGKDQKLSAIRLDSGASAIGVFERQ